MGILSNTVSICQFRIAGDPPAGDLFAWASERLARREFRPIDKSAEELSVGWVHLDDHRASDFLAPASFWRDHYLLFTLRRDQRKLPAALLKAYQQVAEHEYLAANPGLSRVPKQKREELKEGVKAALLARTLPVPATFDAVWDTRRGLLTFTSLAQPVCELFEGEFKKSFEGLRLVPDHPFARAERVVPPEIAPLLAQANRATSDAALDLMKSNRWLGTDFLLWLLFRTLEEPSEYRVTRPGPAGEGEPFVAFLDDRLVLQATGENGVQKVTVAGPQDGFGEVRTALKGGKEIVEATLYLERGDDQWRLTLKGETFQFGSFRAPSVRIEKDDATDAASEKEAVFFERMHLLETGEQLFDSLFAAFLTLRLGEKWEEEATRIGTWLEGE